MWPGKTFTRIIAVTRLKLYNFRVLKYLDNVVKEYSGQVSNILTAIVCAYVFPDRFEITVFIVLSLFLLFWGIYIYEKFKIPPVAVCNEKKSK